MDPLVRQSRLDAKAARAARWLIFPHSTFRTCWDAWLVLLVVYTAFALPFVVCFRLRQRWGFWVADQIVDAFFYLDILLNFFTSYESRGALVLSHAAVAKHYAKHWLALDLLGAFPFEYLSGQGASDVYSMRLTLLRGLRCLRLVRLARLFKFLEKVEVVSGALKLLRLFFGFTIVAHWLACIWFLIGDTHLDEGGEGWMVAYNRTGWNVREKATSSVYITSLYWSVTTLLTVGYGDLTPQTNTERLFAVLTMVFGAFISALIFGNVTMLLESMGRSEAVYREKMESVQHYVDDLALPPELQTRIRAFYTLLWNRNKTFGGETALSELPPSFHHEIAAFLNQDLFDKVLLFTDCDPVFLRNLASKLKFCVALPNDDIIREEDLHSDRMFFLRKGSVSVRSEAHGKLTVLREGSYFGEIGIMLAEFADEIGLHDAIDQTTNPAIAQLGDTSGAAAAAGSTKRTATVSSLVNCDLAYLSSDDFSSLMQHYPQYQRLFLLIALMRWKQSDYHDDEDIVQKAFIQQVKRKELRLRYHRKEKPKKPPKADPSKRRPRGPGAESPRDDSALDAELHVDTFAESTKELVRRVSLLGLPPEQAMRLRRKHAISRARGSISLPPGVSPASLIGGIGFPKPQPSPNHPRAAQSQQPSPECSTSEAHRAPPTLDLGGTTPSSLPYMSPPSPSLSSLSPPASPSSAAAAPSSTAGVPLLPRAGSTERHVRQCSTAVSALPLLREEESEEETDRQPDRVLNHPAPAAAPAATPDPPRAAAIPADAASSSPPAASSTVDTSASVAASSIAASSIAGSSVASAPIRVSPPRPLISTPPRPASPYDDSSPGVSYTVTRPVALDELSSPTATAATTAAGAQQSRKATPPHDSRSKVPILPAVHPYPGAASVSPSPSGPRSHSLSLSPSSSFPASPSASPSASPPTHFVFSSSPALNPAPLPVHAHAFPPLHSSAHSASKRAAAASPFGRAAAGGGDETFQSVLARASALTQSPPLSHYFPSALQQSPVQAARRTSASRSEGRPAARQRSSASSAEPGSQRNGHGDSAAGGSFSAVSDGGSNAARSNHSSRGSSNSSADKLLLSLPGEQLSDAEEGEGGEATRFNSKPPPLAPYPYSPHSPTHAALSPPPTHFIISPSLPLSEAASDSASPSLSSPPPPTFAAAAAASHSSPSALAATHSVSASASASASPLHSASATGGNDSAVSPLAPWTAFLMRPFRSPQTPSRMHAANAASTQPLSRVANAANAADMQRAPLSQQSTDSTQRNQAWQTR